MSDTLLRDAVRRLAEAGVDNPRLDARVLWEHVCSLSPAGGEGRGEGEVKDKDKPVSPPHPAPLSQRAREDAFEFFVTRRAAREPLAYITGHKEFWSLDFEVGPGVLVPRPETETIIEQTLSFFPDRAAPLKVLDLGTGTGCLLAAFLKEFPKAHGLGVDLSAKALAYAVRNINRLGLSGRCELREGDWAAAGSYDVILSNPPYVKTAELRGLEPEVAQYEPVDALDGGPDGLSAYRALAPAVAGLLSPKGLAFVEVGAGQSDEVSALMTQAGLETVRIAPDMAGIPRVLVTGRPG